MKPTILIVEDDRALAEALADTLETEDYPVALAADGHAALVALEAHRPGLVISDVHMRGMDGHELLRHLRRNRPEVPVLLMTAYGTVQKAVESMREGAVDYLVKPFEAQALIEAVERHAVTEQAPGEPVAADPSSLQLLQLARRVAASEATVLIGGESGTGKEVLARYIHDHSPRSAKPFIAINCAAIPENMLEATLFGYEKGAFTGAVRAMPGKFEQAQGGTLLLDEISEMEPGLQAKLLRVLQEREVERIGGSRTLDLDVRVLATSNRDLKAEVAAGRFREDLYYRLNVFPLRWPALRERRDDIVPLAEHVLARIAANAGRPAPRISDEAAVWLRAYDWPGNVRELDNLMQRAAILQSGPAITPEDLHFEGSMGTPTALQGEPAPAMSEGAGRPLDSELKSREYQIILDALRKGSRKAAAEELGISPRTLRYKLARMREAGIALPDRVGL